MLVLVVRFLGFVACLLTARLGDLEYVVAELFMTCAACVRQLVEKCYVWFVLQYVNERFELLDFAIFLSHPAG